MTIEDGKANMATPPSLVVPGMPTGFGTLLSFIKAPREVTAKAFIDWQQDRNFNPTRTDLPGGLTEHATKLLPLEPYPARRDLLVGTSGDEWTAFFESVPIGENPPHGASVLQVPLETDALMIWVKPFTDEKIDPRDEPGFLTPGRGTRGPGRTVLEYTRPGQPLPRVIILDEWYTASSRYAFRTKGPEQPWENTEHYTNRVKRDRFTPEILESYCRKLGIDVFNLDFYSGPSVFTERNFAQSRMHPPQPQS
ncbi:hypothetical protein ACIPY2_09680 [Paenarthrobacter sp. NPDC089675]|uniref:hypothetical protein n=1 Tax=Paenarthrobacter sp. NPDC089675 TaxID=3364376 RepID=UPI003807C667